MGLRGALLGLLLFAALPVAANGCPPAGRGRAALDALRVDGFAVDDRVSRRQWALALVDCLGDPDPQVRDATAYAGLSTWMRGEQLDVPTLRALRAALYRLLDGPAGDGFARPFAALVLAEVARTDRRQPWMDAAEREDMVAAAAAYLRSVDDYRGFDPVQGWRHGVAHGADWLMQLALNPALDRGQLLRVVDAVGSQVVPASHAYVFGEPGRLAAPIRFAAARGVMDEAQWAAWFADLQPRLGEDALAWKDRDWLHRHHDLRAFLLAVHFDAAASDDPAGKAVLPGVERALASLP